MGKRIYELAREWGVTSRDVIAKLKDLGITGRVAGSNVQESEIEKLAVAMGRAPVAAPKAEVGTQRVVEERLVTVHGADSEVTARQKVTEARVRTNVIRRRVRQTEVVREQQVSSPAAPPEQDAGVLDLPDLEGESWEVPPTEEEPEIAGVMEAPGEAASAPREAAEVAEPEVASAPAPASAVPDRPSAPERVGAAEGGEGAAVPVEAPTPPAETMRPAPAPAASAATPPVAAAPESRGGEHIPSSAPRLDDGLRRVQVLGKIDLRRPEPSAGRSRPAPGGAAAPGTPPPAPLGEDRGRRRRGKRIVRKPGQDLYGADRMRGPRRAIKKRATPGKEQKQTEITTPSARKRHVRISEAISVGDLARAMGLKAGEIIKKLMDMGVMATVNHVLDYDHAAIVASEFEYTVENVAFDAEKEIEGPKGEEVKGEVEPRDPVVTVMGHVDHGKTSLLDAIRQTNVVEGEAGGITQHVGAYTVDVRGRGITFIDTPGHEAFTAMRARGAQVTDIVILVVAADDGVMPQTIEAINHARAAGVPILVAINKIDRPDANVERTKQALADHGLVAEDWGGDTIVVPVSAKTREGLDQLLEMVLLQADLLELKAARDTRARGTIIEARLDRGRGPVATVLVREGTLRPGDPFVVGTVYGRIRALLDWRGQRLEAAGPSTPAEILGLTGVPEAGETLAVVVDEATARQVAEHRGSKQRQAELAKSKKVSLDDLYRQLEKGKLKELRVVLKTDVQGSIDALREAFQRLGNDEVQVSVIHSSVGGVTESDVLLASASNAVIIGFNVRPEPKAAALAEREKIDVRLYTVIYDAINEVREALEGMLEPTLRERSVGRAEVRQVFGISGVGTVAGSAVTEGKIVRGAPARLLRDHAVVHEGRIGGLKRFKDDVREVAAGYECGIAFEGFNDIKPGDVIEVYEIEKVPRRITPAGAGGRPRTGDRVVTA